MKVLTDYLYQRHYEHIIIDCPPSLGMLTTNALVAAHQALIVTTARETSADGVAEMINTISAIRTYYNPGLVLRGILVNAYRKGRTDTRLWKDTLEQIYGDYIIDTSVPDREYIAKAASDHRPIPSGIDSQTDHAFLAVAGLFTINYAQG